MALSNWIFKMTKIRSMSPTTLIFSIRTLSSSATISALRAFYLSVHPDFFAQHPQIQKINESSLKRLNSYLEAVQSSRQIKNLHPTKVTFYFRKKSDEKNHLIDDDFKLVNFTLRSHDLMTNIEHILVSCGLSVTHLNEVVHKQSSKSKELPLESRYRKTTYDPKKWSQNLREEEFKSSDEVSTLGLRRWLQKNISEIRMLQESSHLIVDNNEMLRNDIAMAYGLREIFWCSSWQYRSEQGVLRNFARFCDQHKEQVQCLQGKKLVFTDRTMVAADESVCFNVEDVPQQWLQFLIKYQSIDPKLFDRGAHLEKVICNRCGNIKVVRPEVRLSRMRTHTLLSVHEYITILNKITTGLLWMQQTEELTVLPWSMRNHEIMFVTSHDPDGDKISISPNGRFYVDMNCDPHHLLSFLIQKKSSAEERKYFSSSEESKFQKLSSLCKEKLGVHSISKDFDVEHHQSAKFCEKLLKNSAEFNVLLKDLDIRITLTYYSLFDHGRLCVPWDWRA
uniref:T-cell activation inhibitor, mitochondrial-like n=1 Tax=Styela clava TaxID=7725 RepID=UPI001939A5C0|nr:T-cell activation inhibitor, mitochondrial-like [Styela clava]